jgi:hypothetical protein
MSAGDVRATVTVPRDAIGKGADTAIPAVTSL